MDLALPHLAFTRIKSGCQENARTPCEFNCCFVRTVRMHTMGPLCAWCRYTPPHSQPPRTVRRALFCKKCNASPGPQPPTRSPRTSGTMLALSVSRARKRAAYLSRHRCQSEASEDVALAPDVQAFVADSKMSHVCSLPSQDFLTCPCSSV